jgi:hypothetical protein
MDPSTAPTIDELRVAFFTWVWEQAAAQAAEQGQLLDLIMPNGKKLGMAAWFSRVAAGAEDGTR